MTHAMQSVLVLLAVIVAAVWLVANGLRRRRAGSKCDNCGLAEAVRSARPPKSS
jgi:hypothetical protein